MNSPVAHVGCAELAKRIKNDDAARRMMMLPDE